MFPPVSENLKLNFIKHVGKMYTISGLISRYLQGRYIKKEKKKIANTLNVSVVKP